MKVKDLVEKLKDLDPETYISFNVRGTTEGITYVELTDFDHYNVSKSLEVYFSPLE